LKQKKNLKTPELTMREKRTVQSSLFEADAEHDIGSFLGSVLLG
jgi:hypothetical protein